jgi:hypothetical protein
MDDHPSETIDGLLLRLREAGSEELLDLVRDRAADLDVPGVRQMLRNPYVTGEVVEGLMELSHLLAVYEVRSAVARHPRTPVVHGQRLVPTLFWRDLLEITLDTRIAPLVRRAAERHLVQRLPAITLGEKLSLARRAGTFVLQQLRTEAEPRIIAAMLENPRMTEGVLLPMVSREGTPPEVLRVISTNRRWGRRYGIRSQLCRNPRTPGVVVWPLLPGLKRSDLRLIAADGRLPRRTRDRARELLGEESGGRKR